MFPQMLEHGRGCWMVVGQAAWTMRLDISVPGVSRARGRHQLFDWETFDRICKLFGWPQTFATKSATG
jgi:hypothetical protein